MIALISVLVCLKYFHYVLFACGGVVDQVDAAEVATPDVADCFVVVRMHTTNDILYIHTYTHIHQYIHT
jgi:hypothetical protein